MWRPEFSEGAVALLRLPLAQFGDGSAQATPDRYRWLPAPGEGWTFQERFVGDYVLYGVGGGWDERRSGKYMLTAAPVRGGAVARIALPHPIDRIEALGRDAMIAGSGERNLRLTAIRLHGGPPAVTDRYTLRGASESETRSHGFFFHPNGGGDLDGGVLGLPVSRPGRPAYKQLTEDSSAVIFVRWSGRGFGPLGDLAARQEGMADDGCVASCTDWYGNARPLFIGSRAFALMGYELVEGAIGPSAISEVGRANFAPPARHRRHRRAH